MQPKSPVSAVAVKKEEKEARLRSFVGGHLAGATTVAPSGERVVTIVARACDSPVVTVLRSFAPELALYNISVFVVLACDAADPRVSDVAAVQGWGIRCLADARFRDAHEQLVLGDACAWIGDCMRREPLKRDAFECYAENCSETAAFAARSFRQLWQSGRPVTPTSGLVETTRSTQAAETCGILATLAEQSAEGTDGPTAMTRQ